MKRSNQIQHTSRIPWRMVIPTLLLILALMVAGCGGDDEETAADPAPTPAAAAAVDSTVTPKPAAAPAKDAPAADAPAQGEILPPGKVLNSFRARSESTLSTTFADGRVEEVKSSFNSAYVRTDGPFGYDETFEMLAEGSGADGATDAATGGEAMVMISVGENMAIRTVGDQWTVLPRDQENQPSPAFEVFSGMPGEMEDVLRDAKKIGDETVNGIRTTHYRIEDKSVFGLMLGTMMDENEGELVQLGYDLWVAKEGGFAVKYQFVIEIKDAKTMDDQGQEVTAPKMLTSWSYELTDINTPITIEWPADAPEPGQVELPGFDPGQFPLPPETQIEANMFGITTMTSSLSPDEVIAFYTDALTGLGWSMDGMAGFYNWTKDDFSLSMVIGPDEETGGSSITLMPGQ